MVERRGRRGSYGVDAPKLLIVPLVLVVAEVVQAVWTQTLWPGLGAVAVLLCAGFGLYASRRGKFVVWARLLDGLRLEGTEKILDIGCGRGAVLILAAQRLRTGQAVGIDLWRKDDQSGNDPAATLRNAQTEGVADRVSVETADMTHLPFDDAAFDVVVSSMAVHNVRSPSASDQVMDEVVRVVRPGRRLLIADIRATSRYRRRLVTLGMRDVIAGRLGWRMWWSGPWLATTLVTATKPSG